jgi:hypothetical protein
MALTLLTARRIQAHLRAIDSAVANEAREILQFTESVDDAMHGVN